jgi:RNA polymerase sigma-70 factor (ECF subfamily)
MDLSSDPQSRFDALYDAHFRDLVGFALRRTQRPEDAADVVAETFLVVWRRIDAVPAADEARLWLFGVCRRVLANHERGRTRRTRLGARLRDVLGEETVPDLASGVASTLVLHDALAHLKPADRELLQLVAWEGLEPREAAVVLGVPARTVRTRLSRARTRLRDQLDTERAGLFGDAADGPGHVSHDGASSGVTDQITDGAAPRRTTSGGGR